MIHEWPVSILDAFIIRILKFRKGKAIPKVSYDTWSVYIETVNVEIILKFRKSKVIPKVNYDT